MMCDAARLPLGTCRQLVVEQQSGFPAQLTVEQAAGLHGEGVVVSDHEAGDAEIGFRGVSQVGGVIGHAVVHVHLIAL